MTNKYFLITTAIKETWKYDDNTICLGDWCKTYENQNEWKRLNSIVVSYHWDNRRKLYNDHKTLRIIYERLLIDVSYILNDIHNTNHSIRYWRILIGPWLLYFTEIVFDRWECIKKVNNEYDIINTRILNIPTESIIPFGMNQFRSMYITEVWNHYIFAKIIKKNTNIKYEIVDYRSYFRNEKNTYYKIKGLLKSIPFKILESTLNIFSKKNDAFFLSTYLNLKSEILLNLSFLQIPVIRSTKKIPEISPDINLRSRIILDQKFYDGFEKFIREIIFESIPTIYLEGYKKLISKAESMKWPQKPKLIFTSGAYNADDIFKIWAAKFVEKGTPLIIGQHGGNLGSALWTSSEEHENAIADRYLTWGWNNGSKKHFPLGIIKHFNSYYSKWDINGDLIFISYVMPRYSYVMGSYPVAAKQTELSLNDQFIFYSKLLVDIKNKSKIRIFNPDWDWHQAERWISKFPNINIDKGLKPLNEVFKSTRLVIVVYNGTVFLETLALNIPTLIFWDSKYNEIRPAAIKYFNSLENAGILYYSPEQASKKANQIWNKIEIWWYSKEVQDARKYFCDEFAKIPSEPIKETRKALSFK